MHRHTNVVAYVKCSFRLLLNKRTVQLWRIQFKMIKPQKNIKKNFFYDFYIWKGNAYKYLLFIFIFILLCSQQREVRFLYVGKKIVTNDLGTNIYSTCELEYVYSLVHRKAKKKKYEEEEKMFQRVKRRRSYNKIWFCCFLSEDLRNAVSS